MLKSKIFSITKIGVSDKSLVLSLFVCIGWPKILFPFYSINYEIGHYWILGLNQLLHTVILHYAVVISAWTRSPLFLTNFVSINFTFFLVSNTFSPWNDNEPEIVTDSQLGEMICCRAFLKIWVHKCSWGPFTNYVDWGWGGQKKPKTCQRSLWTTPCMKAPTKEYNTPLGGLHVPFEQIDQIFTKLKTMRQN